MKAILLLLSYCSLVFAEEGEIKVFSIAHTNANNWIYTKDVFTRDGRTNLVRILKIVPQQGWAKVCRFYHHGEVVGTFVVHDGETSFGTEAGIYCTTVEYGPGGEILAAKIGDKRGLLLDKFVYTNGTFCPVGGPLRVQEMKPVIYDEAKFIKEAAEAEARLKSKAPGMTGPTSQ